MPDIDARLMDAVQKTLGNVTSGAKKAGIESGQLSVTAYWVGSLIRIDIKGYGEVDHD